MLDLSPQAKHQAALLDTGFTALGESHDTTVRAADGTVSTQSVNMVLTGLDVERVKMLGIEMQNSEVVQVTVSLSALGYRPRPGMEVPLDGKKWLVHGRPFFRDDLCRVILHRRTS